MSFEFAAALIGVSTFCLGLAVSSLIYAVKLAGPLATITARLDDHIKAPQPICSIHTTLAKQVNDNEKNIAVLDGNTTHCKT